MTYAYDLIKSNISIQFTTIYYLLNALTLDSLFLYKLTRPTLRFTRTDVHSNRAILTHHHTLDSHTVLHQSTNTLTHISLQLLN